LHGITVEGFGYLQPDGRGWPISFASIMLDLIPYRTRVLDAARHWQIDTTLADAGLDALAAHSQFYTYDDPRLLHGDFRLDHILIDGEPGHEHVSGILDMQECAGGHPASDLAYWLDTSDQRIPLTTLLASYPDGTGLVNRHAPLITLMTLRRALWMLMVDKERRNSAPVAGHVRNLKRALASLADSSHEHAQPHH
jgi:aminoglycoside phosphotransferase (APT) family kinase protein